MMLFSMEYTNLLIPYVKFKSSSSNLYHKALDYIQNIFNLIVDLNL